jgi:hypothetical protein
MIAMKPPHKFFERILNNNTESLYLYLEDFLDKILNGQIEDIPKDKVVNFNKHNGAPTQLGMYYNIFSLDNPNIKNLQNSLRDIVKEACEYYGHDYDSMDYMIHGWYNYDPKPEGGSRVNPIKNDQFFHDHMGGEGAPVYHGYYCVYAEPSITFYKINNEVLFENKNVNNRAIVSETGHPHGRDDWFYEKPRITIAYDICPSNIDIPTDLWIKL